MKKMGLFTLTFIAVLMAGSAQAAFYEFTSDEGFTNGPVAGQAGWFGGADNIVNTNVGGSVMLSSTNQWQASSAGDVLSSTNTQFSVSGIFSFTEAITNGGSECFSVQLNGSGGGSFRVDVLRVKKNSGDLISGLYAIKMVDSFNTGYGFTTFADTALGVDDSGTDYDSDEIVLSLTLERGVDENDWGYAVVISNLTTALEVTEFSGIGAVSSADMYNSANLVGAFNSARNESTTGLMSRKLIRFEVASTYIPPAPIPGPTIVQWGEAIGDINIVTNGNQNLDPRPVNTTYVDGTEANPEIGTNYYADAINRSPAFNHAASVGFDVQRINDDGNGDFINSGKNLKSYRKMVAWENFLIDSHTLDYLATSTRRSSTQGNDYSYFRWTLKKDNGEWYASDEIATSTSWDLYEEYNPENIDWYTFDPYQDVDDVTFATNASIITMDNVDVIGIFCSFTNSAGGFSSLQTRYFKASAASVPLLEYDAYADAYGLTGEKTDDQDTDGETNWEEYVLGGDPTNDAVQGILPSIDGVAGDYVFSIRADSNLHYYVLTNLDLVNGSWGTNYSSAISVNDGEIDAYTNNVGTAVDNLFIQLMVE